MTDDTAAYTRGDLVRVTNGPFAHLDAIVRDIQKDGAELSVEVTIFGRAVPITTEPWQLARR